jgi:hypothetical protein
MGEAGWEKLDGRSWMGEAGWEKLDGRSWMGEAGWEKLDAGGETVVIQHLASSI